MTARAGLLHTVPALAASFAAAVEARMPEVELVHVVDAALLAEAVRNGVTPAVTARVAEHVAYLAQRTDAVLVTCSSIGEAVEAAGSRVDVPVLRVDATMAADAVARAVAAGAAAGRPGRILVLATLAATLGPTGRLVERAATDAGAADLQVTSRVVDDAAARRAAGDAEAHDRLIAAAVAAAAADADVIVLAQASMAQAAAGATVPVLTSPAGGVAALVEALGR